MAEGQAGIHTPAGGYGFWAHRFAMPRNDGYFLSDFFSAPALGFSAGAPILCDARMVADGVTRTRLPAGNDVVCTLHDPRVMDLARELGTTRTAAALELCRHIAVDLVEANTRRADLAPEGIGGEHRRVDGAVLVGNRLDKNSPRNVGCVPAGSRAKIDDTQMTMTDTGLSLRRTSMSSGLAFAGSSSAAGISG